MLSKLRSQMGEAYYGPRQRRRRSTTSRDIGISSGKVGGPRPRRPRAASCGSTRPSWPTAIANDSQAVRRLFGGGSDSALRPGRRDSSSTTSARRSTPAWRRSTSSDRRITDDLARTETRLQAQREAPEGPVRGDGDGAQQRPDAAELAHRPARRAEPELLRPKSRPARADHQGRPEPLHGDLMTAYASASPAAYKTAEHHDRDARAPRRHALRRRHPLPLPGRRRSCARAPARTALERMDRGEAIVDHLLATLDMSAGEIAERLEGIYVFCKRLLLEARREQRRRQGRPRPRLPHRAARVLGADRRRVSALRRPRRPRRARADARPRRALRRGRRAGRGARRLRPRHGARPPGGPPGARAARRRCRSSSSSSSRSPATPRRASSRRCGRGRGAVRGYAQRRRGRAPAWRSRPEA